MATTLVGMARCFIITGQPENRSTMQRKESPFDSVWHCRKCHEHTRVLKVQISRQSSCTAEYQHFTANGKPERYIECVKRHLCLLTEDGQSCHMRTKWGIKLCEVAQHNIVCLFYRLFSLLRLLNTEDTYVIGSSGERNCTGFHLKCLK